MEVRGGETPSPASETLALPGTPPVRVAAMIYVKHVDQILGQSFVSELDYP
jgi:hypothetical protein